MTARRTRIERRLSFLNAVLAANAVLLAALVWTNLAGGAGANIALAAPQSGPMPTSAESFPNASSQRLQIISELKGLRSDVARVESILGGGRLKVNVGNPGDIKFEIDYAKLKQALKE